MSGVVIVDDYADEVEQDEPISAQDEQNLKEIEDYIFNNVSSEVLLCISYLYVNVFHLFSLL